MKKNRVTAVLLCASPLIFTGSYDVTAEKGKMNVLFIMVDDLNDWISVMGGHPQAITPNIERLAAMGMVFTNAHCPSPLCGPARASIMTGYYPPKTGVFGNTGSFRNTPGLEDVLTMPQYFSSHGYKTIAAGKIFHHHRGNREQPLGLSDPGSFDEEYVGTVGTSAPEPFPEQELNISMTGSFGRAFVWGPSPESTEETGDYRLSKYVADFLGMEHEKPFFAAAGIFRPHLPWFVPQQFFDMYPMEDIMLPEVYENDLDDIPQPGLGFIRQRVHDELIRLDKWKEAVRAYLACITFADYCIGVLLDALEASDYKDNTIIILSGDHGFHLGEKTHWTKYTLWERATLTPLIVHVPGLEPGRSDAPVNLVDIYPTLVDLCNLPEKPDLEGNSLRQLIENPDSEWPYPTLTWRGNPGNYSIKDYHWRYIHYNDGSEELYNHAGDANEWFNLAGDPKYRGIIDRLREKSGLKGKLRLN
jgi:arylsulfatase A-like enzyme